jgi:transcriptional regulator with XRE-family HTH domain
MKKLDLKRLRTDNSLNQSDLVKLLGVKQSYVSDLEQHKKPISAEHLTKLRSRFEDIDSYFYEEAEIDYSNDFISIMKLQAESLHKKDEQMDRLITIIEQQLKDKTL